MFLFKKLVSQFFFPMPVCLGLCFAGLSLLWWTKRQRKGKILVCAGLLLLTAFSYKPVADALLRPPEIQYPAYPMKDGPPVRFVVVLGGGCIPNPNRPLSSQLSEPSIRRLGERIRIYRENPGSKLILSGGSLPSRTPAAVVMAGVAKQLGVTPEDIVNEVESRDTEDEARLIAPMLTTNSFVLVTSASHLP